MERLLIWGAQHPVKFVGFVALSSWVGAALLVYGPPALPTEVLARAPSWLQGLVPPKLARNFNAEADAGVAWGVQGTLVALLYPFVISFVALLVQQRSHAPSAIRVYLLDSRALPGGASSIALLLVMGVQQFLFPFVGDDAAGVMGQIGPWLLISNLIWLTTNIILSSVFLVRTLRFLQDEERSRAYTRVALNVVLPLELQLSVHSHIVASAPWVKWGEALPSDWSRLNEPQVRMLGSSDGIAGAQLELKAPSVLEDVHLRFLQVAAYLWRRRAKFHPRDKLRRAGSPVLDFLPFVGEEFTGAVVLVRVQEGPTLSRFERFLIRSAYHFRPLGNGTAATLRSKRMLQEQAAEVVALMDQGRHAEARDFFAKTLVELHKALLAVCTADDIGIQGNVATISTSAHAWSHQSWDKEWLGAYREILEPAVNAIERDSRVFSSLAHLPGILARALPVRPESFLLHALETAAHLQWKLGQWWANQLPPDTHAAGAGTGAAEFRLPGKAGRTYEKAIVDFLSGWGYLRPRLPRKGEVPDEQYWLATTANAKLLVRHLEHSVIFYVEAVLRGDGAAASWFHDHFLKWEYQQLGREHDDEEDTRFQLRHVGLSFLAKSWNDARTYLWDGGKAVSIELAERAALLVVRRYWEAIRVYVVHLLMHFSTSERGGLALSYCGLLLRAEAVRDGGRVRASSLNTPDLLLAATFRVDYGDSEVRERLEKLAEELSDRRESLRVALWMYSIVGSVPEFQSLVGARAKLLAALCHALPRALPHSTKFVQDQWRDLPTLQRLEEDIRDLQAKLEASDFAQEHPGVTQLQSALGHDVPVAGSVSSAVAVLRMMHRTARWEYEVTLASRPVSPKLLATFAREVSIATFGGFADAFVEGVAFDGNVNAPASSLRLDDFKRSYTDAEAVEFDEHAKRMAEEIRSRAVVDAFARFVSTASSDDCIPVVLPPQHADAAEASDFLRLVVAACEHLSTRGSQPVVVAPRAQNAWPLRAHRWQSPPNGFALPEGLSVTKGEGEEDLLSRVNGAAVFELPATVDAKVYVVPRDRVRILRVAGGSQSAVTSTWRETSSERVEITLTWKAGFGC